MIPSGMNINKKYFKKGYHIAIISIFLILVLLMILLSYQRGFFDTDFTQIAIVNGQPVYVKEFKATLRSMSIDISSDNINDKNRFDNKYNEITKDKVMEEIVKIKIQQLLAQDKGILKSSDYKDFIKELNEINSSRKEALKENKVIYGPDIYGEVEYYNYSIQNIINELKENLKESELRISEEILKDTYRFSRETRFMLPKQIIVQIISIPFTDNRRVISEIKKTDAKYKIYEVINRVNQGECFELLSKTYNSDKKVIENIIPVDNKFDTPYSDLLYEANKLKEGQISDIIERKGDYVVIKSIARKSGDYLSYEDAREILKNELLEQGYSDYIHNLVMNAEVVINDKVYNRIRVR
ncbi:UNVERIFIED_CONTAM: hypothetical protein Cloal_2941 [Acetivibrio alkalicellulosi]